MGKTDQARKRTGERSRDTIQLINLYRFALDTQRWSLFDEVFAEDCEADYGATSHRFDRASSKADFAAFHALFDATEHVMTNHLVVCDVDTASAHTYQRPADPIRGGIHRSEKCAGYYHDQLARPAAGWRIGQRVCRVISWTRNVRVQTASDDVGFQLDLVSLRGEADAGRLRILARLDQQPWPD